MLGLVSNTDRAWFDHLASMSRAAGGRLDEVNFWRPRKQQRVKIIPPGAPFFLRLKRPTNAIAGWGFFAHWRLVPFREAWQLFGQKNGAPSFDMFRRNIARLRGSDPTARYAKPIGCVMLRDVTLLPAERWFPWGASEGWNRHIVNDNSYDLTTEPGSRLMRLLAGPAGGSTVVTPPDLIGDRFQPLDVDERRWREAIVSARDGQGTFRSRLLDAYGSRCALTGERVVPVLEAAHIQPYMGPASNHIQNGLLLRADLHNLYDAELVGITPDYRFRVSERVRAEYDNGEEYYELERSGARLRLPSDEAKRPSRDALAWHLEKMFR